MTSRQELENKGYWLALKWGCGILIAGFLLQFPFLRDKAKSGTSAFDERDFVDVPALANQLKLSSRPFDRWMTNQLSASSAAALVAYQGPSSDQTLVRRMLVKEFNALRDGKLLYGTQSAGINLRADTQALLNQQPDTYELRRLNRLLLEDAYPLAVAWDPEANRWNPILGWFGSLFATVATVLATVGTGALFRDRWMRKADEGRDEKFRRFFGESAVSDSLRLVHAERWLEPPTPPTQTMKFRSPSAHQATKGHPDAAPEGIGKWLSAEDNYAATALTALFSQRISRFPRQVYDSFVEDDSMSFCTVGLGLGFNEFTHFACAMTRGRMFRIVFKKSVKEKEASWITDEFVVPYYHSDTADLEWHYPIPSIDTDVAIILRIPTPLAGIGDYSTQFVVAGRSAPGTAIAGAFLATRWEYLHDLYAKAGDPRDITKDALMVILEHKREPRLSGIDASRMILTSGARCYLGDFQKLEVPNPPVGEYAVFPAIKFDDKEEILKFAKSIRENGYGFYNPNVVDRQKRTSK